MMSIRIAKVSDAAAITHVHVQSWLTTYEGIVPPVYLESLNETGRVPMWQDWLARDIVVLVAEMEGEVVGFASGGAIRESVLEYDCELYALYLLQRVQRCGIGRALMEAVMDALVKRDYRSMLVWVLAENPAVRFYERAGANPVAQKQIEIGGASLAELGLGWQDLPQARRGQPETA